MKNLLNNPIMNVALHVTMTIFIIGIVSPMLISAADTMLVILGFAIVGGWILYLINLLVKQVDKDDETITRL